MFVYSYDGLVDVVVNLVIYLAIVLPRRMVVATTGPSLSLSLCLVGGELTCVCNEEGHTCLLEAVETFSESTNEIFLLGSDFESFWLFHIDFLSNSPVKNAVTTSV